MANFGIYNVMSLILLAATHTYCNYYLTCIISISFEDVENEKDLDADDDSSSEGASDENKNDDEQDNEDYQKITAIYAAITAYRGELRKLQTFQREDIR